MIALVYRVAPRASFALGAGVLLPLSLLCAQPPEKAPQPLLAARLSIVVTERSGNVTPERSGVAHTGGGNTDVAQLRDDTVVITMAGVAVAGPHPCKNSAAAMTCNLNQCFAVVASDARVKGKLTLEAAVLGLLRGDKNGGTASIAVGRAAITVSGATPLGLTLLTVDVDGHTVDGADNVAINDHKGPVSVPVLPGEYHLVQTFRIDAAHVHSVCGTAAAAEFAPDPALDPMWIAINDPFRGANKKEFGFRVIVRVESE